MKPLFALALAAGCLIGGRLAAQDTKHPNDRCPPGKHTVTVVRTIDGQVRPWGVGAGASRTETHQVCRDNKTNNIREQPRRRR